MQNLKPNTFYHMDGVDEILYTDENAATFWLATPSPFTHSQQSDKAYIELGPVGDLFVRLEQALIEHFKDHG